LSARQTITQNEQRAQIFSTGLMAWRSEIVALQKELCRQVLDIALANPTNVEKDPVEWANEIIAEHWRTEPVDAQKSGIKVLGRDYEASIAAWVAEVCDGRTGESWLAPGYLSRQVPESIRRHCWGPETSDLFCSWPNDSASRLPQDYTRLILDSIISQIENDLLRVKKEVLEPARAGGASSQHSTYSASSRNNLTKGVRAICQAYTDKWNTKRADSIRELYATLHSVIATASVADAAPKPSKKKPGPETNLDRHRAIANVVKSFGDDWKPHLEGIAARLDKLKIAVSPAWQKRSSRPAFSWRRQLEYDRTLVVKAIINSLKMA
jgi:hypothetical protein